MKKKKKKFRKTVIFLCVLTILIETFLLFRTNRIAYIKVHSGIAKPIIKIEKDEALKQEINEKSFPLEYHFAIQNYEEDEINQVDFDYVIEITDSGENFPVEYQLYDADQNEEIALNDGKSETLKIEKNTKESRNFKLCMNWKELDGDLAENIKIGLKVNVVQSKEGEKSES